MVSVEDYQFGANLRHYQDKQMRSDSRAKSDYDEGREIGRIVVTCGALGALAAWVLIKLEED